MQTSGLTKDDVRSVIALLRRQQQNFVPGSWRHQQVNELVAKLEAAYPSRKAAKRCGTLVETEGAGYGICPLPMGHDGPHKFQTGD